MTIFVDLFVDCNGKVVLFLLSILPCQFIISSIEMFGLSDHDLMFSRKPDDFDYETEMAGNDFNYKVSLGNCLFEVNVPWQLHKAPFQEQHKFKC